MKNNILLKLLLTIGLSTVYGYANTAPAEPIEPKVVNQESIPTVSSRDLVEQSIEQYANKKNIVFGELSKGKIYFYATSTIPVGPTNSQWAKYRTIAYEKSMLKAQKEFVKFLYQKMETETIQKFYDNQSDNARDIKDDPKIHSKFGEIFTKLQTLVGAQLDKALNDLGIDPSEYNAVPRDQRKKTFQDNFSKKMMSKSMGSLAGVLPIQTIEGKTKSGGYSLGVVIVYSEKLKQLASDITKRKLPLLTKKTGNSVKVFIPKDNHTLLGTFGPRIIFLEDGTPAIISYAQWSHNYTGKREVKLERRRESAQKTAMMLADTQIVEFLSAKMTATEERTISAVSEEAVLKNGETGDINDDDIERLIDIAQEHTKKRAKAKLQGVATVKKWRVKLENGNEAIGVIRLWSYAGSEQASQIKKWKSSNKPKAAKKTNVKITSQEEVRTGLDVMDTNDF